MRRHPTHSRQSPAFPPSRAGCSSTDSIVRKGTSLSPDRSASSTRLQTSQLGPRRALATVLFDMPIRNAFWWRWLPRCLFDYGWFPPQPPIPRRVTCCGHVSTGPYGQPLRRSGLVSYHKSTDSPAWLRLPCCLNTRVHYRCEHIAGTQQKPTDHAGANSTAACETPLYHYVALMANLPRITDYGTDHRSVDSILGGARIGRDGLSL